MRPEQPIEPSSPVLSAYGDKGARGVTDPTWATALHVPVSRQEAIQKNRTDF